MVKSVDGHAYLCCVIHSEHTKICIKDNVKFCVELVYLFIFERLITQYYLLFYDRNQLNCTIDSFTVQIYIQINKITEKC